MPRFMIKSRDICLLQQASSVSTSAFRSCQKVALNASSFKALPAARIQNSKVLIAAAAVFWAVEVGVGMGTINRLSVIDC